MNAIEPLLLPEAVDCNSWMGMSAPPKPVRVCFMIDELRAAGTESQLVALIQRLDRSRVEPFLCLLRGDDPRSRAQEPCACRVLRLGFRSFRRPGILVQAWKLAKFLRRRKVDVLQTYFPDSTLLGMLVGRLAGVSHLVRTRNNQGYWMTAGHRRRARLGNRFVDVLLANCEACRQAVIADEDFPAEKIVVLENGVDLGRFPLASTKKPTFRDGRRVGIVANLRPVKDLESFVRAAARIQAAHADATFHIAGEGELRMTLERLAADLNLRERLFLPGSVADVPAFLGGLDVAVLCSRSEGMSNALLEYMAAGKAIVATAVGGNVRLIEDGVHGLLVPPGDPEKLAGAVGRLLADPILAARLGKNARRRVEEHFSREVMVRRFEDFYEDLVEGRMGDRWASKIGVSLAPKGRRLIAQGVSPGERTK